MQKDDFKTNLSKKGDYILRREEKESARSALQKKKILQRRAKVIGSAVLIAAVVGLIIWYIGARSPVSEGAVISRSGLHWHSELSIIIKGEKQEIPAGIGLGVVHNPVHTHQLDGIVHLEFSGVVKKESTELGKLFDAWGKQFNSNCIFEFCNSQEGRVKMLVNGKENSEFEKYQMHDLDKIEIIYE